MLIVSLDGGGVYGSGIIAAYRKLNNLTSFNAKVDAYTGTSAGALLTAALANNVTPEYTQDIFNKEIKNIFTTTPLRFLSSTIGICSKYSDDGRMKVLSTHFKDVVLSEVPRKLIIPVVEVSEELKWNLKIYHNFSDNVTKLVDVLMATTAAPLYFDPYLNKIDGGVIVNHPGIVAVSELVKRYNCATEDIFMLSIGFDWKPNPLPVLTGWLGWAKCLSDLFIQSDTSSNNRLLSNMLGERYFRLVLPDIGITVDDFTEAKNLTKAVEKVDLSAAVKWINLACAK